MPLEALSIPENLTESDSDGIGGGTGCNFIFFFISLAMERDRTSINFFLRGKSPGEIMKALESLRSVENSFTALSSDIRTRVAR